MAQLKYKQHAFLCLGLIFLWISLMPFLPAWMNLFVASVIVLRWGIETFSLKPSTLFSLVVFSLGALLMTLQLDESFGIERIGMILLLLLAWRLAAGTGKSDLVFVKITAILLIFVSVLLQRGWLNLIPLTLAFGLILTAMLEISASKMKKVFIIFLGMISAIPVASVLFVVFPRSQAQLNSASFRKGVFGFSDSLDPGRFSELSEATGVVLRILNTPAEVNPEELYFRGSTLSQEKGLSWRKGKEKNQLRSAEAAQASRSQKVLVFDQLIEEQGWLFAPELTHNLKPLELETVKVRNFGEGVFRTSSVEQRWARMEAVFSPESTATLDRSQFLSDSYVNFTSNTLEAWVASLRNQPPEKIYQQIQRYFLEQGFEYERSPQQGIDLEAFLTQSKKGFCEHYAAATASLMRRAGVPTRLVIGYFGSTKSPFDDYWLVTKDRAHAWLEFENSAGRWQRADPTRGIPLSAAEMRSAAFRGAWVYLRQSIDFLQYEWVEPLAGQLNFASLLPAGWEPEDFRKWSIVISILFLVSGILVLVKRERRRSQLRQEQIWIKKLDRWGQHRGLARKPTESMMTHIDQNLRQYLEQRNFPVDRLLDTTYQVIFREERDPQKLEDFKKLIQGVIRL